MRPPGGFDPSELSGEERAGITEKKSWFRLGEVVEAGGMAGIIAVPAGMLFAGTTEAPLAVIGAAVIFLPKLMRQAMKADVDGIIDTFGRNEQVRKAIWGFFTVLACILFAEILDPGTARQIVELIAWITQ